MEKVEAFVEEYLKLEVLSNPCDVDVTWYNMIRAELLRKTVQQAEGVLDVGCGRGEVLLMLSKQIGWGVGVDISEDDIVTAENTRKKQGIKNVEFRHANALDLPFALSTFDVVLHCKINSNRVASVPDRRFGGQSLSRESGDHLYP